MADWDWVTIAGLATALGTVVLALATFGSTRSANRAARAAERALLEGLRPVLVSSRMQDPGEKVLFADGRWVRVDGGRAAVEVTDEAIYLVVPLRNVGQGLAVLHGWDIGVDPFGARTPHGDPETYRRLTRDLYVPGGDLGFWQGAMRDPAEPAFAAVTQAVRDRTALTLDVLYGDHEGGQRMISRFALVPYQLEDGGGIWLPSVSRHWNLDRPDPR